MMFWSNDHYLHCKPTPVMKTGFSLCSISSREKPVFINLEPCNENRFFPVWKYYTGKTLFWHCTGPVRDCSVHSAMTHKKKNLDSFGIRNSCHKISPFMTYIIFATLLCQKIGYFFLKGALVHGQTNKCIRVHMSGHAN